MLRNLLRDGVSARAVEETPTTKNIAKQVFSIEPGFAKKLTTWLSEVKIDLFPRFLVVDV